MSVDHKNNLTEQHYIEEIEEWRKASRIHAETALQQYEKVAESLEEIYFEKTRNDAILAQLSDAVVVLDGQGNVVIWNQYASKVFSLHEKEALGKSYIDIIKPLSKELCSIIEGYTKAKELKTKQLTRFYYQEHFIDIKYSKVVIRQSPFHLFLFEDNTEIYRLNKLLQIEKDNLEDRVSIRTKALKSQVEKRIIAQKKLEVIAHTDGLTGLPNRLAIEIQLNQAIERQLTQTDYNFAILFLDLDGFKVINDTLGHQAGDDLLKLLSGRMLASVRGSDTVARLGGDEFIVLLHKPGSSEAVLGIADKLINQISKPVSFLEENNLSISSSIGIWLGTEENIDSSTLLSMADSALYEAKRKGKNRHEVFNKTIWSSKIDRVVLTKKLETAFSNQEFVPYFQAICDLDGNITGAEVLSRWLHDGEIIPPSKFIPILEQRSIINRYTKYLIGQVVNVLVAYPQMPRVSINLSIQQFHDNSFLPFVLQTVGQITDLKDKICFEITESMFNHDPALVTTAINQLRELGFRIYIDDFGTGYSSFSYIRHFDADVIKIDREFVMSIEGNKKDLELLNGMISLMRSLHMDVIVEGVERTEQLELIQNLNQCVELQGFLLHKPVSIDEFLLKLDT